MKTKRCTKCGEVKPYDMFHKQNSKKIKYASHCKACRKAYYTESWKAYYRKNKERILQYQKKYRQDNKEKIQDTVRSWNELNREKYREHRSRRRAVKRKAIPKFLRDCEVERQRLRDIYKLREVISLATGIEHHVDHMWPISDGGPHWSGNLQIITAKENLTKSYKVCKVTKKNIKDSLRIARKEYENSSNGH